MEISILSVIFDRNDIRVLYNINGVRWVVQMRSIVGNRWLEYSFWTKKHYASRIVTDRFRRHVFTRSLCIIQSMEDEQIACVELEMRTSKTPIIQSVEQLLNGP